MAQAYIPFRTIQRIKVDEIGSKSESVDSMERTTYEK
jgi:hypothetical protein